MALTAPEASTRGLTRRTVLAGSVGASALGAGLIAWLRARGYEIDPDPTPRPPAPSAPVVALSGPAFDPRARETLAALFTLLLPGDRARGLPSAQEAGVLAYVERAARLPGLRPIRDDLLKLSRFLDRAAKPERFADLDVARTTQLLLETQANQQRTGRFVPSRALEVALRFALEGYLGHPHHGGNPGFASWEALAIDMPRQRIAGGGHGPHGGHGG